MSILTIGPAELCAMAVFGFGALEAPPVPWDGNALARYAATHVLVFTPRTYADATPVTLISLRDRFGIDPSHAEPCFYNQDWYLKEAFATITSLDGQWHLLPREVRDDFRAKAPDTIELSLAGERFPTAVTAGFAFFACWLHTRGQRLWEHDFLWCSDRDHNGDRIYVGRYEDPDGVNRNGFNVHRHLSVSASFSAAPEAIRSAHD